MSLIGIIENARALPKHYFFDLVRSRDFSRIALPEGLEEEAPVQGFALLEGGTSLAGRLLSE
jgi:hypothetical protein